MNLLPETWIAHDFMTARWVTSLADALGRGGVPQEAVVVPLSVSRAGQPFRARSASSGRCPNPDGLFAAPPKISRRTKDLIGQPKRVEKPTLPITSGDLPPYTRSLLRTKMPVVVILADKRKRLSQIVELVPGSIIQFDKSCQAMLDLEVGNQAVAAGEAVKVGDKFGLRITAMVLPDERFKPR